MGFEKFVVQGQSHDSENTNAAEYQPEGPWLIEAIYKMDV